MQTFYDISNLLTTFQMSYICHQVAILAYKILIKNICIISTPYGNKTIIIWWLNMYINLIITYQGALKSNTMTRSYNIKGADSDVLFNCGSSQCIKRLSCNFILKSLVPLAKTDKSSKDTMLLQTNIWSRTAELLVMMIMMNCFCGMVDRRKAFSLISSRDHCQRSSPLRISDTPRAGFEPPQNLSSGLVEWSCAVVTTTTPRRHTIFLPVRAESPICSEIRTLKWRLVLP